MWISQKKLYQIYRAADGSDDVKIQIHMNFGLIYPCINFKYLASSSQHRTYKEPMVFFNSDGPVQETQKVATKSIALCTIILSEQTFDVDKIKELNKNVDLHVFTGISPDKFDEFDNIYVHHVNRVKFVKDKIILEDNVSDSKNSFQEYLAQVTQGNAGLYDFIDCLKVIILKLILDKGYEYVGYQDFIKLQPMNNTILSTSFQKLIRHFGIIYGAGFLPEINCLFVHKNTHLAVTKTLELLLKVNTVEDDSGSVDYYVQHPFEPKDVTPTIGVFRQRFIVGMRLIRILFHIGTCEDDCAKNWLTQLFNSQMHLPSCATTLINSKEDILFAVKSLSQRCIDGWQRESMHSIQIDGVGNGKVQRGASDKVETALRYNYIHNALMRQWFLWENASLPLDTKVYVNDTISTIS